MNAEEQFIEKAQSCGYGYVSKDNLSHLFKLAITSLENENRELRRDRERLLKLANLIWETRWVAEEADYQILVGIAAEIRSGNFEGIDKPLTKAEER